MNLKKMTAFLLTGTMLFALAGCKKEEAKPKTSNDGDKVVFTVGDQTVTKAEYEAYISLYTQNGYSFDMAKDYAKEDVTNNVAMIALVNKQGGFSDDEKKQIEDAKKNVVTNQGGEEAYQKFLDQLGVDDSFIEKSIQAQYAQAKLFDNDYSDDAIKAYFNDNYLRAKHILLMTQNQETGEAYDDAKKEEIKKQAEELLNRAKGGEDFDEMVKEYSQDPGSKSNPDGYYFTAGEMVSEFENCTRELEMGGFGLCESTYGYHIIQRLPLEDSKNADLYNTQLDGVKDKIKTSLTQQSVEEKLPELLKENGLEIVTDEKVLNSVKEK